MTESLASNISDLEEADTTLQGLISALTSTVDALDSYVTQIFTMLGSSQSPIGWTGTTYVLQNDSFKSGLEHVDVRVKAHADALTPLGQDSTTHANNLASLIKKISTNAFDGEEGLELSSYPYFGINMRAEVALIRLEQLLEMVKEQMNVVRIRAAEGWRDFNTTSSLLYDQFHDTTKIDVDHSTGGILATPFQKVGLTNSGWTLYSIIFTVPGGTNTIKMKWSALPGTIAAYVVLDGNYASASYTAIPTQDTWVTVGAGTQLIVKFVGTANAFLTGWELLHKIV